MLFFAIVYLVEGIGQARVGIIYQPLTHYLKETGWTALQVAAYFAVLNFPWVIKPVFGLVSDFVPLFGYRRKSYLIIASLCAVGGYAVIARQADPGAFALPLLLTSYAMATASTLCGALLAENGQSLPPQQQLRQPAVAVVLHRHHGVLVRRRCADRGPARPLRLAGRRRHRRRRAHRRGAGVAVPARREEGQRERGWRCGCTFQSIVAASRSAKLYLVALFLFLYSFAPGFGTPLYYFMTDELKFSQSYIGILGAIASAGWIAGALVHRFLLRGMSSKALLTLSIVLRTVSAASFLLLADPVTAAIVNFANGVALMIATIASLTLAADYCPKRAEGFAFAGLMSIMNLAELCSSTVGAWLYDIVFDARLGPLIIVSAASTAFALVLVPLLRLERQRQSLVFDSSRYWLPSLS